MWWANRLPIMDCDEIYNYWEPLHFLQYKSGFQTWEYAPSFALRTYAYLLPLHWLQQALPEIMSISLSNLLVDHTITTTKLASFVGMRSFLAGMMGLAELVFLSALSYERPFADSLIAGGQVLSPISSMVVGILLLFSTGMAHASAALLPSSSIMLWWLWAASAYLYGWIRMFCGLAVVATLTLGWPFGVVVFLPMGVDILWRHCGPTLKSRCWLLFQVSLWTILVQGIVMYIDHNQYGIWTSPTLNIFQYNAQAGGDELYGTEPFSYYVKNLLLNFNYVAIIGIIGFWPLSLYRRYTERPFSVKLVVLIASLYLWLTIVGKRPHKEERFLFPIYPTLCLAAVVVMEQMWRMLWSKADEKEAKEKDTKKNAWYFLRCHGWILLLLPSCIISCSRTYALHLYYTAPTRIYAELNPFSSNQEMTVCTCGEWYRFPSSYYLPSNFQLKFLKSSFTGQLPKAFTREGSKGGTNFNGKNQWEPDRILTSVDECDFVVDLRSTTTSDSSCVPSSSTSSWKATKTSKFLNADETPFLHRALYIPLVGKQVYDEYILLRKTSD